MGGKIMANTSATLRARAFADSIVVTVFVPAF